jgi:quercetin dioxygenase-like cupin family protein
MHMKTTRIIAVAALIGAGGLALQAALAQQPTTKRIDLQRHDLSIPGRETIQAIVEIAPGQASPRHTHPGEEIIYVLEGSLGSPEGCGRSKWLCSAHGPAALPTPIWICS